MLRMRFELGRLRHAGQAAEKGATANFGIVPHPHFFQRPVI